MDNVTLRRPQIIRVAITPFELFVLVEALEARACRATANPATVDVAGHWFDRAAELREAAR
jgi:hypothetical protein